MTATPPYRASRARTWLRFLWVFYRHGPKAAEAVLTADDNAQAGEREQPRCHVCRLPGVEGKELCAKHYAMLAEAIAAGETEELVASLPDDPAQAGERDV